MNFEIKNQRTENIFQN